MKSQIILPLYTAIIVLALIIIIFFMDKDTPKTVFVFLLLMYIGLILFYWRQYTHQRQNKKIPSLSDFKTHSKRSPLLSRFQSQCQSVLQQINMQKKYQNNQSNYFSPFSHTAHYPISLKQLPTPTNDYPQQSNIFGTYNIQIWRQQFRQAAEQFKQNLASPIKNNDVFKSALTKLNLDIQKVQQAEEIVGSFLKDRIVQYCTQTVKVVSQINKILARNFGLSLTKVQSANQKQIGMSQLSRLLNYYENNNRTLPSRYKNLLISSPSRSLSSQFRQNFQKTSMTKLNFDMQQLVKYIPILQPMAYYPSQRFNPCMLIYILKTQFPNEKIQINKQNSNSLKGNQSNPFNSFMLNKQNIVYNFLVQVDHWMSLASVPEFRTKNCLKICLIFLLVLVKKQNYTGHPMLRLIKKLLK